MRLEKDLKALNKSELIAICVEECLPFDDRDSKQALIDIILSGTKESLPEDNSAKKLAHDRELARRLGRSNKANSYEQELARRRGAGSHISSSEAMALEIERRKKAFRR